MKCKTWFAKIGMCVTQLLFPRRCPFCDEVMEPKEGVVCQSCQSKVERVKDAYCLKCGKALFDVCEESCGDCKKYEHTFDRGRVLLIYQGPVKRSLYRFKYCDRREYAKAYVEYTKEEIVSFVQTVKPDVIIPVPLHISRFRKRGYNQAELLAREISRCTGILMRKDVVLRTIKTAPQKGLDFQKRQNNLKRAFKIARNDVKLETTMIIDDIYTTGSTMDALATLLKETGAKRVYFITLSGGR